MIILRQRAFSKKEKKGSKVENGVLTAAAIGGTLPYFIEGAAAPLQEKLKEKSGDSRVKKKIKKLLRKDPAIKEESEEVFDKLRKESKTRIKHMPNTMKRNDSYDFKKKIIRVADKDASTLAHELGHAHFHADKKAGLVPKIAHKLYLDQNIAGVAGISSSIAAGIDKAKKEERGEEESKIGKAAPYLSAGTYVPVLVSEGAASIYGQKLLKKAGASEKLLKAARKSNGKAFNGYVAGAAISTLGSKAAKNIAYKYKKRQLEESKMTDKERELEKDKRKLKRARNISRASSTAVLANALGNGAAEILTKGNREISNRNAAISAGLAGGMVAAKVGEGMINEKLYKKYHPEDTSKHPKQKDINRFVNEEMGLGKKKKRRGKK